MAKQVVTRTYKASIRNHQQVSDDLDSLGFAASKLWNVGQSSRFSAGRMSTRWSVCPKPVGHNRYC